MVNSHISAVIERFQGCDIDGLLNGNFLLSFTRGYTGTVPNNVQLPVYLFELNSCLNDEIAIGGTPCAPCIAKRLVRSQGVSPVFDWNVVTGYNYDYSAANLPNSWVVERSINSNPGKAGDMQFFEWFDIRMLITGARKVSGYVDVQLVQFTDEYTAPSQLVSGTGFGNTGTLIRGNGGGNIADNSTQFDDFWLKKTTSMLGNPIAIRGDYIKNPSAMRVLQSKRFKYQPTSTIQTDVTGHQTEYKMRYNYNKMVNFTDPYQGNQITDIPGPSTNVALSVNELENPNEWTVSDQNNRTSCYPDPRKLVYLMVTGSAPSEVPVTPGTGIIPAATLDSCASFDLIIRRKRSQLGRAFV